mmetsp:Transcript_53560/g.107328  ORF Transcript_53560/g.107328 Transcript_53560/m.107328 type:complete len:193 (-) Transcript_53560:232-810(-)
MKTDAAVVGLLLLWVVMNLLLLNLVVAIMSSTYEAVKEKAEKVFLFDMYEITIEYSRRSAAVPWPVNVITILFDLINFFRNWKKLEALWKTHKWHSRLDLFLRRNLSCPQLHAQWLHKNFRENPGNKRPSTDEISKEEWTLVERDMEVEQYWELKMSAFMERARNKFLQSAKFTELKEKWHLKIASADDGQS